MTRFGQTRMTVELPQRNYDSEDVQRMVIDSCRKPTMVDLGPEHNPSIIHNATGAWSAPRWISYVFWCRGMPHGKPWIRYITIFPLDLFLVSYVWNPEDEFFGLVSRNILEEDMFPEPRYVPFICSYDLREYIKLELLILMLQSDQGSSLP